MHQHSKGVWENRIKIQILITEIGILRHWNESVCKECLWYTCLVVSNVLWSGITAQGTFLIQLNADSLYLFACWSLCLLCLLILMLIILMLILIESRSMLIVYWLGERKLNNAYLKKNSIQNINFPKEFLKIWIDEL